MNFRVTGPYGELAQVHGPEPHHGIDLATPMHTMIRSIGEGTVSRITHYGNQNIGNGVIVKEPNGNWDIYGHLSEVDVHVGQKVHEGTTLGLSGNSGNSSGPHLHFGIQKPDGSFVDPTPKLQHLEAVTGPQTGGGGFWDTVNHWSAWLVGKEGEVFVKPAVGGMREVMLSMWHWFITNLPDLMGYGTLLFGALIILGSMAGKGKLIRIAGLYGGLLILAMCILGSV